MHKDMSGLADSLARARTANEQVMDGPITVPIGAARLSVAFPRLGDDDADLDAVREARELRDEDSRET